MFRTRAVKQLLVEEIAGLARSPADSDATDHRNALERAQRRAALVIALDWIAIAILIFVRSRAGAVLAVGPNVESIFAIGLLAIAVHSGFRLGQLEKIRSVIRTIDELDERSQPGHTDGLG